MSDNQTPRGAHFAGSAKTPSTDNAPALHDGGVHSDVVSADDTTVFMRAARGESSFGAAAPAATEHPAKADVPAAAEGDTRDKEGREAIRAAEKSSNALSYIVIFSRITGFFRTVVQAWALGAVGIASSYTVADQMPNVLYELVAGGMLITSFLPVYMKVKKQKGSEAGLEYASNLLSIVLLLMAILTVLGFVFASPVILSQSVGASSDFDFDLSVWFFRWFAIEIIFYALSSVFSGVLNAERDYYVSNVAPILNNVVLIAGFLVYGYLVESAGIAWQDAVLVLAIANPLGVAVQVLVQWPALKRHGVHFKLRINWHDPALRDTLAIGLPTLIVTFAAFPTNAVMSSCALSVTAAGASISYYARVWYVLPFSLFVIPISVTLFTELSDFVVKKDMKSFRATINLGTRRLLFTLIPLAMLLITFSGPLISVFAAGKFTSESAHQTAVYLAVLSLTLPFYGLSSFLQKACSSLMRMKFYAFAVCVAAVIQIVFCLVFTPLFGEWGLYVVPFSSMLYYGAVDLVTLMRLRAEVGSFGMKNVLVSVARAFGLGILGSLVGYAILTALSSAFGPCMGMLRGVLYSLAGGLPALVASFGVASFLGVSEAPFFDAIFRRILPARQRNNH